ncbi:hypothetical protein B0H13DRAFT_2234447 [Mycena leptocephala]|nr:hypothetical protein B0H13DRAFT_2234447 [Mycena leptocephala]
MCFPTAPTILLPAAFLVSLTGQPTTGWKEIRNISIITARNSQKDALNKMGAEHFTKHSKQVLHNFYSINWMSAHTVDKLKWKTCLQSEIKKMSKSLQSILWDAAPSITNEFMPGKLPICMGMPVILRANDATELCITKGQKSVVFLDTLFVTINIDGLPKNVVALTRLLSIIRDQIVCLLNFGMTDYTSQGKSIAKNPVELAKCNDHQSYYVALSRGFTAEGTILIQGFLSKKVTSGMKGHL